MVKNANGKQGLVVRFFLFFVLFLFWRSLRMGWVQPFNYFEEIKHEEPRDPFEVGLCSVAVHGCVTSDVGCAGLGQGLGFVGDHSRQEEDKCGNDGDNNGNGKDARCIGSKRGEKSGG